LPSSHQSQTYRHPHPKRPGWMVDSNEGHPCHEPHTRALVSRNRVGLCYLGGFWFSSVFRTRPIPWRRDLKCHLNQLLVGLCTSRYRL
jgi:hypothetical protein